MIHIKPIIPIASLWLDQAMGIMGFIGVMGIVTMRLFAVVDVALA